MKAIMSQKLRDILECKMNLKIKDNYREISKALEDLTTRELHSLLLVIAEMLVERKIED